jgi:putative SOS response-associated peptidase YedK
MIRFERSCHPVHPRAMTCWPVSPRVGNVKNNDPSLIEPIASAG